jgi:hypothetical protein
MIRDNFFAFKRKFSPIAIGERDTSLTKRLHNTYRKTKRLKANLSHAKKNVTQALDNTMQPLHVVTKTIACHKTRHPSNHFVEVSCQKKSDINYPGHVFEMLVIRVKTHFS